MKGILKTRNFDSLKKLSTKRLQTLKLRPVDSFGNQKRLVLLKMPTTLKMRQMQLSISLQVIYYAKQH